MSKYNKELIDKLRNGEIALEYDNKSLEDLRNIMKEAFPQQNINIAGVTTHYFSVSKNSWSCNDNSNKKSIPIKDFIQEEFVLPEKWCILRNEENYKIVNDWLNKGTNGDYNDYDRYVNFPNWYDYNGFKNGFHIERRIEDGYKEITFEQFKKYVLKEKQETMEKYKFTVDYVNNNNVIIECINSDEAKEVNRLINGFNSDHNFNNYKHVVYLCKMGDYSWSWQDEGESKRHKDYFQRKYPNVKFEIVNATEFIKNNTKMENNKEIIGYKAPYDLYDGNIKKGDLVTNLRGKYVNSTKFKEFEYGIINKTDFWLIPKEIVETWEPVYKLKEQVFNMGSFEVIVKDGKAFHKNDDITIFVKDLVGFYNGQVKSFGAYSAVLQDVVFSKTGCENNQTKLSDWKKVYNALNQ